MNQVIIDFLVYRITSGALMYKECVMKRPDLKEGIDVSLQEKKYEHLINDNEKQVDAALS
ncbi:hypothetical protein MPH48_15395 [Lysinibacillus fusiformis]|uniref:hypothetical protein n=1 Tax=Lysinibacillus fusiformis TaxID=28031 RepID=UPI001F4DE352|nr:hypothetical protein [Lysinibacillus fusiformis]MCK1989480.1 hypothetical protein [Lysinibacillus fusiformis]